MAKRPWLLTPAGQRTSLVLAFIISLLAIAPAVMQLSIEDQRDVPQLDTSNITYCELSACGDIAKVSGLKITDDVEITEAAYGTKIKIRVINSGRLSGEREVWAQVRTETGSLVEGMRTILKLTDQGPQHLEFQFSGNPAELAKLRIVLGF